MQAKFVRDPRIQIGISLGLAIPAFLISIYIANAASDLVLELIFSSLLVIGVLVCARWFRDPHESVTRPWWKLSGNEWTSGYFALGFMAIGIMRAVDPQPAVLVSLTMIGLGVAFARSAYRLWLAARLEAPVLAA